MAEERLWTRNFVVAFTSRMLTSVVFTLLNATIAAYALAVCRVDAGLAGVASGVFILSSVASRIVVGRFTDVVGRRKLIVLSGALLGLSSCAYLVPAGVGALILVRCVHGVAHGVSSNTVTTVIVDAIPETRRGEGLGFLNVSTALATAIGPFAGILLLQCARYEEMFLMCAVLTLAGFLLSLMLEVREVDSQITSGEMEPASGIAGFFESKSLPMSVVVFALCLCSSFVTAFLNPYCDWVNLSWCAPWFFVVYAVAMALSRLFLGRIADRRGDNIVICPLLAAFAMGLFLLIVPVSSAFFGAAVLLAFGYGGLFPCFQAIAVRGVPSSRLSVATSTFFALTDAGLGLGPIIGGSIVLHAGYQGGFVACVAIAILCAALYWVLHGRKAAIA